MEKSSDIVKKYYQASASHDETTLRTLVQANFQFDGPMMQASSAQEFFTKMAQVDCNFEHNILNMVEHDTDVAVLFDCTFTKPFSATIRMSEWLTVENGKIKASKLLYDTGQFPKDFVM